MGVQVISAEMRASNDFKINGTGEAPTIYSGSMGTYDSATDSYYFSSNCGMDWKNWSNIGMTLEKAQKLTKIEFEWEGLISNYAYGQSFDAQMQTYFNTNLLFINGIADGYYDAGSDYQRVARIKNSGSDQWQTTELVPFNNSQYMNAFHKMKWVWEIENSVAKELTVYLDGNLFCHYSGTLYSFSITALGTNILRFATIDHTNVRYIKVVFYHDTVSASGGAGSGYIGNALVSNKKMVGYNVPTSSAESTKTESVNEASESPVSGKPKIGNGHVKIKLLRQSKTVTLKELLKTTDFTHIKDCRNSTIPSEYLGTDWLFVTGQTYGRLPSWDDANEVWYANEDHAHAQYVGGHAFAPIKPCYIHKAKFDLKFTTTYDGNPFAFYVMKINNNTMADSGTLYPQITQNVDITDHEVTFNPPIKADYFHVYCGGSIADIIYQISNMTLEVIEI